MFHTQVLLLSKRSLILIVLIVILTGACAPIKSTTPAGQPTTAAEAGASEPTQEATATRQARPTPTETPAEELAPLDTPTAPDLVASTATPEPVTITITNTPVPMPVTLITVSNANQIQQFSEYGSGRTWEVRLSTDGGRLFVASVAGIKGYDAVSEELLVSLPAVADCEFNLAGEAYTFLPSTDGQKVAVCSGKEIRLYTLDGQMSWSHPLSQASEQGQGKPVPFELSISPDLNYFVFPSQTSSQQFEVWEAAKNQLVLKDRGENPLFSADSQRLGVDFNGYVWLYNILDWSKKRSVGISSDWVKLFLPDGDHLALLQPNLMVIYRLSDGKLVRTFAEYQDSVKPNLFVSPDGTKIAWTGNDYPDTPLSVWSIPDGKLVATLRRTSSIWAGWPQEFTRLGNDGLAVVNSYAEERQSEIDQALLSAGTMVCVLHNNSVDPCSPGGENLSYDWYGRPFAVRQDVANEPNHVYGGLEGSEILLGALDLAKDRRYFPVTLTSDERYLLTSSLPEIYDRIENFSYFRSELWNLESGRQAGQWEGRVDNVAFSSDDRYGAFLVGRYTGQNLNRFNLLVYDFVDQRLAFQLDRAVASNFEPVGLVFLPQGEVVYAYETVRAEKRVIVLNFYDLEKWQPRREIVISDYGNLTMRANNHLPAMAASPDGKLLAVALADNRVVLYDLASGMQIHSWTPHNSQTTALQFSSDGTLLGTLSAEDGLVKLWGVWP